MGKISATEEMLMVEMRGSHAKNRNQPVSLIHESSSAEMEADAAMSMSRGWGLVW